MVQMLLSVQQSFQEVINDVQSGLVPLESFWINLFSESCLEEYIVKVDSSGMRGNGVHVVQKGTYRYEATMEGNVVYRFKGFRSVIPIDKSTNISALGCSVEMMAFGDTTGRLMIVPRGVVNRDNDTILKSSIEAHFADITCTAFFPSGKALLTGLVDMQLKLWLIDDGVSRRVFRGHTGAINAVELLGATGRNFLSASEDGSVRLWETGTGSQLYEFRRLLDGNDPATSIVTVTTDVKEKEEDIKGRELDFETQGVLVYVGYRSGHIRQYDVYKRQQTGFHHDKSDSIITCMCYKDGNLYIGHEDGTIEVVSEVLIDGKSQKMIKKVAETAVNRLLVINNKIVAVVGGTVFSITPDLNIDEYFVGAELVECITSFAGTMYTGGKEGIKEYQV